MEDEEYKKLPIEDRCVHKLWKARVSGYEDVTKLFRQIDDEKSPEFGKYLGLVKKFVTDSNAMGQEKGLEATLAFIENYAYAGKTVGEVMSGVVTKCIAAPKTKTRELALQIILMYIEIEKHEAVQEELIKGMDHKNPKIVTACVSACTTSLREFGTNIINVKPLVKKIPVLFADRDKDVRGEARQMAVEIYRWIGAALRPQLANLQPVQVTELEAEFAKLDNRKATPTRYVRSQQEKQIKLAAEAHETDGEFESTEESEPAPIDPYDLADPVDILSKLPKDFYEKIEAKKWQERKEVLETLENLLKTPKLENGDYGDLVRALRKVIQKDSNVIVVALGGRCLASLASGLKKRFNIYSSACVSPILEKFKEKKTNVVTALRDAIDAVYQSTTIEAILEDVIEALNNKNPSVKAETTMFLARCFTKTPATMLNKKLLKALTAALIKNINEPDPTVRDCAAEALGTLMKLVGEKAIGPFLLELEKDNLKMAKIKECCEKAVLCIPSAASKKERPTTAPTKTATQSKKVDAPKSAPTKTTRKVGAGAKKKAGGDISSGTATIVKSKGKSPKPVKVAERELNDEEVDALIANILNSTTVNDLSSANWKNRLSSSEQFLSEIQMVDAKSLPAQAIIKTLIKKPGLKDTNFQVLKVKLDIVKYLAENATFSTTTADCCLNDICDKFGDPKNGNAVCETLTAISEVNGLDYVSSAVVDYTLNQKSPKVTQESLIWLSNAIQEFGFTNLNAKLFIESCKKALASNNPGVRQASITLLGILYLYMGNSLNMFLENERPALKEQISTEFTKYDGMKPPAPTRGLTKCASADSLDELGDAEEGGKQESVNIQDTLPRVDISSQITESLINELNDKNWKVRNEALTKVSVIIQEASLIKPSLGDLPQALALRLTDSNTKIAQTAMNTCEALAKAIGSSSKQYIKVFFPGFLQGLGDNKSWMRTAALDAINTYAEQCGYKEFFENEMVADALKAGSPTLRSELWLWLSTALPKVPIKSIPREELMVCIPYLYSNLEDRNADVRKNAQEAILGFMTHIGYENMVKNAEKLKPGSRTVIMTSLEKVVPMLPTKPLPKKQSSEREEKTGKSIKTNANSKNAAKTKVSSAKSSTSVNRKKDDDIDTSPLLVVNNMKHQRTIDESKLKVLKWNFTTPREEFVELLKDQMLAANVNKTLIFNMFHADFRYHLKAIDSLMEDVHGNSQALISNLDLILKWLTLRFFDTNPSVLLRGLEYLHSVFNMLIENHYHMLENEAASFIPYLILKIGDPKDAVRNGVRSLFRQICEIYAVSRLFSYVMEGVKSKNARQRAECLELMGSILEDYGISVCLPTPAACLKEVAKQISDRDNSVRNAALNCIVQAYHIIGEKVYKMIGNISDKDMSLLEERIKRAARRTLAKPIKVEPNLNVTPPAFSNSPQKDLPIKEEDSNKEIAGDDDMDDEDNLVPVTLPSQLVQETEEVTGPFKLDPEFMKQLDSIRYVPPKMDLKTFDLDFLKEDIKIPSLTDARARMMPLSPPKPVAPNEVISRSSFTPSESPQKQEALLEKTINQIGSPNKTLALQAMEELQEILQSPRGNSMIDYEDTFMTAITKQLRLLRDQDPSEDENISKVYRKVLTIIDTFYLNKILGRQVSVPVLKDLISELVILLVERKLEACTSGDSYIRVVNLHCVKIIERSDHTRVICALINLLQECIRDGNSPKLTDLVMKCLWRVIKLMPQWGDEINYDSVLLEVHEFLKEFPSLWWKRNAVDTPLRTVKTILHSSVKIKGSSIMLHLGKIPNTSESEVESYILRLLKGLKIDEVKQVPLKNEQHTRSLSRANHNMLTDIFQKIGSRNETKEGLTLLYDFLQQHPEADIEPFLKKSSKFFQDYIKNGLQEIEESRKISKTTLEKVEAKVAATITPTTVSSTFDNANKGPEYWKERLNMWNRMWDNVQSGTK